MTRTKKKGKAQMSKALRVAAKSGNNARAGGNKEERRLRKLEQRRRDKAKITPGQWAEPAPAHLVGKLNVPKVKSKYKSYFEFAENKEKKKKLEFQVTKDTKPPPGFAFVPVGDPDLTNMCKDLSRNRDAMMFIVSSSKEGVSKVSEHTYRTGYHFREAILDDARALVGDTILGSFTPGQVEPIPESQEEINKQANAAIRDLFPRIPNTDRTMILEHAFQKGVLFHGEKTVGLQPGVPLSRRIQLAVLAHIRHTHTRYDQLLKETQWINARKVVEPVCLDILVKWRGDEETGRDQLDEILREVVVITDSENEDEDEGEYSTDEDASDKEGEVTPESSPEVISQSKPPILRPQVAHSDVHRPQSIISQHAIGSIPRAKEAIASRTRSKTDQNDNEGRRRGNQRYRDAWAEAQGRRAPAHHGITPDNPANRRPQTTVSSPTHSVAQYSQNGPQSLSRSSEQGHFARERLWGASTTRPTSHHSVHRPTPGISMPGNQVISTLQGEQRMYPDKPPYHGNNSQSIREQRPSQVVRRSPQRDGFQDMLVPSIEMPSGDPVNPPSHVIERRDIHGRFNPPQESHPRMALNDRRLSPPRRQVIVIDDDSPQVKRRRMVREDDSGQFRPLPSRDYTVHATSPPADSHFMQPSSVQSRHFPIRRSNIEFESSQGLLGGVRSSYHSAERIPIYDAPGTGSLARPPEYFRRDTVDTGYGEASRLPRHMGSPMPPREAAGEPVYRRQINASENGREIHHMRTHEFDRGPRHIEPGHHVNGIHMDQSSNFPVSSTVSRPYDMGHRPVVSEQVLSHELSQSRLDGQVSRGNGFACDRPRIERRKLAPDNLSHGHENGSLSSIPPTRARSPVRSEERSMYREEKHRPVFYEQNQLLYDEHYAPHNPALINHGHATHGPPRRQVITLD